ncbi:MAG TPA: uracil-DNA glycosylase family protein, partial [Caldilineaceae bacterium]|nr:uracil-DNA glycosylase family protein [Caldilineaceae bacterium]
MADNQKTTGTTAGQPADSTGALHFATLDALVDAMQALDDDPLASTGSKMVIYRGNPAARLMIVGEAPGPQENKQGKPFVGPSGKLLEQILASVELSSEED